MEEYTKNELKNFVVPSTNFLVEYNEQDNPQTVGELEANKELIEDTLFDYDIDITDIKATQGPTITLYEIKPAPGIRISSIRNLADDIALSIAALSVRIIAPIPGKGTIGIEVPNAHPKVVSMKSMIESTEFQNSKAELPIVLGKSIENEVFVTDLVKAPHILVAGATGQGKSVGLNVIIASLLYKKSPSELKFVFIDPKKVELSLYSDLENHYLAKVPEEKEAVLTEVDSVERTLQSLCKLMDKRYNLLKDARCKKITEYNEKIRSGILSREEEHEYMPYIVVVIDEFADLIMTAGKKIEEPICRLAQLARAVGIHLIIATQRPSVDIITGKIKANFPTRIAFKTSSKVDSQTILDSNGAEQLIGRGDMLLSEGGRLTRLQCAFIDTPEIENLVQEISKQQGYSSCYELPTTLQPQTQNTIEKKELPSIAGAKIDPLFKRVASAVVESSDKKIGSSFIQMKFALGYSRACDLLEQLEAAGIVSQRDESYNREVLVQNSEELEKIFAKIFKDSEQ
ncbi:MAG: DNA translocase FtsK [Bacteroidota bacterium]|nr:DNA translocase FtsK [Bacteroidota bacterium]